MDAPNSFEAGKKLELSKSECKNLDESLHYKKLIHNFALQKSIRPLLTIGGEILIGQKERWVSG